MFGQYRTLSAKPAYSYTNTHGWVYHGRSQYSCDLVINIILAETSLRSTVQREDAMNNKIRAAEKLADIDGNSSQLKQLEKKLEKLKKRTTFPSSTNTLRMGVYAPCGIIEKMLHFCEEQSCLVSRGRAY